MGGKTRAAQKSSGGTRNRPEDVTKLLLAWGEGQDQALEALIPIVHDELRRIARRYLANERSDHTLQPTALVNEMYLKLINVDRIEWQNRAHFLGVSARLMRQILVDHARRRQFQKRGGGSVRVALDDQLVPSTETPDLLALDEALNGLAKIDARKVRVVELRFFGGLGIRDTAETLKISEETVNRDWRMAKAWLRRELERKSASPQ